MFSLDMILVTYNPNLKILDKCIKSIYKSVRNIYIIDNNSNDFVFDENINNIRFIKLKENMGIAYAQNIGIKESIKNNSDYILLSDQDTVYPVDYIERMMNAFLNEKNICAITPLFKDSHSSKINNGFYKKSCFFSQRFFPEEGFHNLFHTIASGKIIKTQILDDVGLMNEDLFIDWVDYEWCWRARNKGYKIIGNANVIINHQLGDYSKNIGFREVNLRNHIRHYYITRNAFYLAVYCKNLNLLQRITLFFKSFRYIVGYPILTKPHLVNFKYVLLGFLHGLTNKLGKLKEQNK